MRPPSLDRALLGLIAASLLLNVFFLVRGGEGPPQPPTPPPIGDAPIVGTRPPPLDAVDLRTGRTIAIAPATRDLLIYVITPGCNWCKRNAPVIASLWEQLKDRYDIRGVTLSVAGLDEFLKSHPIPFDVASIEGIEGPLFQSYGLGATPNLILLSAEGVVLKVWSGAMVKSHKSSVEDYFGVTLPPLSASTQ